MGAACGLSQARGARYLDPVGGVMNDGGLRLLQREKREGREAT